MAVWPGPAGARTELQGRSTATSRSRTWQQGDDGGFLTPSSGGGVGVAAATAAVGPGISGEVQQLGGIGVDPDAPASPAESRLRPLLPIPQSNQAVSGRGSMTVLLQALFQ